jgi:neuroligin
LASYGDMIVVTLNFRLGILGKKLKKNKKTKNFSSKSLPFFIFSTHPNKNSGFLNANPAPHLRARVANYGLMDQMAALHWIQQNIENFGGNPSQITLVGHGTGAACIDFLMASPTMGKLCCHCV